MKKSLILLLLLMPFLAIVFAGHGRVPSFDNDVIDDDTVFLNDDIIDDEPIPGIHGLRAAPRTRRASATPNPHGVTFTPNPDVNCDGAVDVADINYVIVTMTGSMTEFDKQNSLQRRADVNGDSVVDVADIASIITAMANGAVGHQAIDLGLPSGTLWANMNVGGQKPEDYGLYFAWGETVGYTSDSIVDRIFDYESYKWMVPEIAWVTGYTKYQSKDSYTKGVWYDEEKNFIGDGKAELDPEDDAAHVFWGDDWEMPTREQITELADSTTVEWTTLSGVAGCLLTSRVNGNTIFLPAAGVRTGGHLLGDELGGLYWSKSQKKKKNHFSTQRISTLAFLADSLVIRDNGRYHGFTIRPVLKK